MKRVCILTSGHPPYDDRIFYKEARSLKKAGLDVRLICSTGRYDEVTEGIRVQGFRIDPFLTRILIGRILQLVHFVRLVIGQRCDICHCHEFGVLVAAHVARLIGRTSSSKKLSVIYDVHEWFPWEFSWKPGNPFMKRIRTWTYHKFHSFLCNRTDYIIVNEKPKLLLFKNILDHSRLVSVENFPPLDLFHASAKTSQGDDFTIAYAGGLSRERGIYELARATQIFAHKNKVTTRLLLIGDFHSRADRETFLQSFTNPGFELTITGWIPHPHVPLLLNNADICAIPWHTTYRFTRSLPVKLYEYMALSKPTIASDLPEIRDVIDKAGCGILVDPSNSHAISDAIQFYHTSPAQLQHHGENGRHWVETQFNWAKCEKKLLSVYANFASVQLQGH